jgi:hypothetical protein
VPIDKASEAELAVWETKLKDSGLAMARGKRGELCYGEDPAGSHSKSGFAWGGKWGATKWGGFDYTLKSKRADGRSTPDARLKCRERETGTTQAPETVAKRAAALTGKTRGPLSADCKANISAAKLGKPQSAEHVAKRAGLLKGKKYSKRKL